MLIHHDATEMYEYYQIMICLLKLDFFVFVGVTMQVSSISSNELAFMSLMSRSLASHRRT